MEIGRFKQQHQDILDGIAQLRQLSRSGIQHHADELARGIVDLSQIVTRHLAVEDRILYPSLRTSGNPAMAEMGRVYQEDMQGIATSYIAFSRRWGTAAAIAGKAQQFRDEANTVLKSLYLRMKRENHEFYPAVEAM